METTQINFRSIQQFHFRLNPAVPSLSAVAKLAGVDDGVFFGCTPKAELYFAQGVVSQVSCKEERL
jgi:hypothetical protein